MIKRQCYPSVHTMFTAANELERGDSSKRRRLSERRRAFGRLAATGARGTATTTAAAASPGNNNSSMSDYSQANTSSADTSATSRQSSYGREPSLGSLNFGALGSGAGGNGAGLNRCDSPLGGDRSRIQMKIQFHITVTSNDEPLLIDTSQLNNGLPPNGGPSGISEAGADALPTCSKQQQSTNLDQSSALSSSPPNASSSIGDHIHERLQRQSTLSQRRRQQLIALHNQSASSGAAPSSPGTAAAFVSEDNLMAHDWEQEAMLEARHAAGRSSTFSGVGPSNAPPAQNEGATHLLRHAQTYGGIRSGSLAPSVPSNFPPTGFQTQHQQFQREHVYFKRDGQRFGHEFTLKLAVDRTYRCLLKVRPLLPLAGITVHGHHAPFVDCTNSAAIGGNLPANLPPQRHQQSPSNQTLSRPQSRQPPNPHHRGSWQHISTCKSSHALMSGQTITRNDDAIVGVPRQRLSHAYSGSSLQTIQQQQQRELARRQQSQMLRHFAATHCSSLSGNSHLMGSQLIYMFDWSATRFEVNRNKARTELQLVLKFRNGQILALPLQVKFYEPNSRQHLEWGSQLHFIDYDCSINSMGHMSVDRVQYY